MEYKLEVENSFINYFSKKTEIYKGMKLIDEELGGTTPLEVILKFPETKVEEDKEDDEFEDWDEEMIKMMKNIGLLKTRLIQSQMFITI